MGRMKGGRREGGKEGGKEDHQRLVAEANGLLLSERSIEIANDIANCTSFTILQNNLARDNEIGMERKREKEGEEEERGGKYGEKR